jgi:hypothetical protein
MHDSRFLWAIFISIFGIHACSLEEPGRTRMSTPYTATVSPRDAEAQPVSGPDADTEPLVTKNEDGVDDHIIGDGDVVEETEPVFASGDAKFRCRASGAGGRQADLRMENKGGEIRFRAKWEINVGQGQVPGTVVNVAIAGVNIGGITLQADGDQLEGDIELRGGNQPAVIRNIRAGTPVVIGALQCTFASD